MKKCLISLAALWMIAAACTPATPTPTPTPTPKPTAIPTITPTITPLPPTWTPTYTRTPLPPTPTDSPTPTPTPLDLEALCDHFAALEAPQPDQVLTDDDLMFFMWNEQPNGMQVRLVFTQPRMFNVLRTDIRDMRSNGVALQAGILPFSGAIDWQLLLLRDDEILCRTSGQMQKATPSYQDIFTTPTPLSGDKGEGEVPTLPLPEATEEAAPATEEVGADESAGPTSEPTEEIADETSGE